MSLGALTTYASVKGIMNDERNRISIIKNNSFRIYHFGLSDRVTPVFVPKLMIFENNTKTCGDAFAI